MSDSRPSAPAGGDNRPAGPPATGHYGRDLFPPERQGEAARIDYGAMAYDDVTFRRLEALGAGPGWACLDAGAGTGTVTRWLAGTAGVESVVAVDRDTRFLAVQPGGRVHTVVADLADPEPADPNLGSGRFDLVHCRFVLMHLPRHDAVLARLADWVAPGGWLVVSDAVDLTTARSAHPAYRRTMAAMWHALSDTIGTDISWVTDYPELLRSQGLSDVGAEIYVPPLTPDAPVTAFWRATWERMRAGLESSGLVDAQTVDEALAYLASPELADLSPGMITSWGRRPA
ncbi:class I SAM-dependent methyltransferase [Streptomyces fildesensis]|uniref:Class I SAM-dependent methyltransferase n=1 Tax=Streptomyces fildesensis TaxID=375757 RepID=A0ABW8C4R1_9ACTN